MGSHLFQRVASFLHDNDKSVFHSSGIVLISFREWLHSYFLNKLNKFFSRYKFSSLSESGFIPTAIDGRTKE